MEKEYTLKVSEAELNIIGQAIGKLPFEMVAALVGKLNQQIQEQQNGGE